MCLSHYLRAFVSLRCCCSLANTHEFSLTSDRFSRWSRLKDQHLSFCITCSEWIFWHLSAATSWILTSEPVTLTNNTYFITVHLIMVLTSSTLLCLGEHVNLKKVEMQQIFVSLNKTAGTETLWWNYWWLSQEISQALVSHEALILDRQFIYKLWTLQTKRKKKRNVQMLFHRWRFVSNRRWLIITVFCSLHWPLIT